MPPCPYKPFGLDCTQDMAHGSPHMIAVEAAFVEKFILMTKEAALREHMKDHEAESALADAIVETESRPPRDNPKLRALLQGPSGFDDE